MSTPSPQGHQHFLDAFPIRECLVPVKRAGIYLRVSTDQQTTKNQLRILQEVAKRSVWTIVQVFEDAGISGAKRRDKRPGFDSLLKAVHRRQIDMVAAFAVDRLGRSLPDLVATRLSSVRPHSSSDFDEEAGPRVLRLMGNVSARLSITLPNNMCPFHLRTDLCPNLPCMFR